MVFEGEFFFNDIPRWNLGWATPNYAGAFLATLLCFAWAIRGKWRLVAAGLFVEAALYFLIAKTYSRGAGVALAAGAIFFLAASGWQSLAQSWRLWVSRAGIVGACVVSTGFFSRMDPVRLASDGAAINRLSLWRGGLEMIASAPWSGWGPGESGRAYMNWHQDIDRTEIYTTMVNSYLHVAVERGLFVLASVLMILLAVLIVAWRKSLHGDAWTAAAGASLFAWAVANVFTTLWIARGLWVVPVLAIAVVIGRGRLLSSSTVNWRAAAGWGMGGATVISGMLYAGGVWLAQQHPWRAAPRGNGTVELVARTTDTVPSPGWHVWPDAVVFGPAPGKELRRWMNEVHNANLYIYGAASETLVERITVGASVLLSGRYAERLGEQLPARITQLWVVHPSVPPPTRPTAPVDLNREIIVVLPAIDETGLDAAWRVWAKLEKAKLLVSPGCGLDLRNAWPQMSPKAVRL